MNYQDYIVAGEKKIRLKDFDPGSTGKYKSKKEAKEKLDKDIVDLASYQDILYAQNNYSLLLIFQARDAAGKDSTIKHVMSGVNPQGCQVFSFKAPSSEELDHDYLWRCMKALPERGRIGIFNRSYYEEVLVTKVHPEILKTQQLPDRLKGKGIYTRRFREIVNFERYLVNNGIMLLKFFLNVSKEEQKNRFLDRINRPDKNWKFSLNDVEERKYWDAYTDAFEIMLNRTSRKWAPWHVIPADKKWYTRMIVADIIRDKLKSMKLKYPEVDEEHKLMLQQAKQNFGKE